MLTERIRYSQDLIQCWYESWGGKVYVSFSGGLDSTALLHLVRAMYPDVPGVFVNTGLEYPEIVQFVNTVDNVIHLRPKMSFSKVIQEYGWPVVSKEQAQFLHELRLTKSAKLRDIRLNGNKWGRGKVSKKWKFLIQAPFKISHKCCEVLKKRPVKLFEKKSGLAPMLGNTTEESSLRRLTANRWQCNAYECRRPTSKPLTHWTHKNVTDYISQNNIPYSSIYDMGYDRTGCMFCLFGADQNNPNKIQMVSKTHPKQHDFIINKLGAKEVMDFVGIPYEIED